MFIITHTAHGCRAYHRSLRTARVAAKAKVRAGDAVQYPSRWAEVKSSKFNLGLTSEFKLLKFFKA